VAAIPEAEVITPPKTKKKKHTHAKNKRRKKR